MRFSETEPCELMGGPLDGLYVTNDEPTNGLFFSRDGSQIGHAYRRMANATRFVHEGLIHLMRFERGDWTQATAREFADDRETSRIVEAEAMRLIREERKRSRAIKRKERDED